VVVLCWFRCKNPSSGDGLASCLACFRLRCFIVPNDLL
jgi:hypothetical protein